LRDELAESRRQEAEEQRQARMRELGTEAGGMLSLFLVDYEQLSLRSGKLQRMFEELSELGNDGRQIAQRIKQQLSNATPASLQQRGWHAVAGFEVRILPMIPPRGE